jgi:hypothetical protein
MILRLIKWYLLRRVERAYRVKFIVRDREHGYTEDHIGKHLYGIMVDGRDMNGGPLSYTYSLDQFWGGAMDLLEHYPGGMTDWWRFERK